MSNFNVYRCLPPMESFEGIDSRFGALKDVLSKHRKSVACVASSCHAHQVLKEFIAPCIPVIIRDVTNLWGCNKWLSPDGKVIPDAMLASFSDTTVPVVQASYPSSAGSEFQNKCSARVPSTSFTYGSESAVSLPLSEAIACILSPEKRESVAYIKDWHFTRDCVGTASSLYDVPTCFASDYLNLYYEIQALNPDALCYDDYRFCYFGAAGSWTALHHDVMYSCSWSANVTGTKLWILVPPESSEQLYDGWGQLAANHLLTGEECAALAKVLGHTEYVPDSCVSEAKLNGLLEGSYFVLQGKGEAIFVPPGWHHHVHNLETTLSINHNWFNHLSMPRVWNYFKRQLRQCRGSLQDCAPAQGAPTDAWLEWERQVQCVLRINDGLNLDDVSWLTVIARSCQSITDDFALQIGSLCIWRASLVMSRLAEREPHVCLESGVCPGISMSDADFVTWPHQEALRELEVVSGNLHFEFGPRF
jgi:hypothetical protein